MTEFSVSHSEKIKPNKPSQVAFNKIKFGKKTDSGAKIIYGETDGLVCQSPFLLVDEITRLNDKIYEVKLIFSEIPESSDDRYAKIRIKNNRHQKEYIDFVHNLDEHIIKYAEESTTDPWFSFDDETANINYRLTIRKQNDEYMMKILITVSSALPVVDENGSRIPIADITKGCYVRIIQNFKSVWFKKDIDFGINYSCKKIQVMTPPIQTKNSEYDFYDSDEDDYLPEDSEMPNTKKLSLKKQTFNTLDLISNKEKMEFNLSDDEYPVTNPSLVSDIDDESDEIGSDDD